MKAFKLQMPGNNSEENIQHSKHGKSLKSRINNLSCIGSIINIMNYYLKLPDITVHSYLYVFIMFCISFLVHINQYQNYIFVKLLQWGGERHVQGFGGKT
jgi:hypothetical protein